MSHRRFLIVPILVGAVVALEPADALACGGSTRVLSAAEQARTEKAFAAQRTAVQARNISEIDRALPQAKVSAANQKKAKSLRDEAARLSGVGELDDADQSLREAWKTLGHPELFVVVVRPKC